MNTVNLLEKVKSFNKDIPLFIGISILIVSVIVYAVTNSQKQDKQNDLSASLGNVKPVEFVPKNIGTGNQVATFSHGKDVVGPKISTVEINPIDPKQGSVQNLFVSITHETPVLQARANVHTDNGMQVVELELMEGTATDGVWSAEVLYEDSYDKYYMIDFVLEAEDSTYQGGLRFR